MKFKVIVHFTRGNSIDFIINSPEVKTTDEVRASILEGASFSAKYDDATIILFTGKINYIIVRSIED